ncbi:MAG: Fic family protein [Oligoflexia bacterium]|nr:Fic family protein [Oligoflexia bacterium]
MIWYALKMLSFQLDNESTKLLIALNEAVLEKNTLLAAMSTKDKEAIHHYAWISTVGASTRIENAILTDSEVDWLDSVLEKDAKKTAFEAHKKIIADKFSKDKERSLEEVAGCRTVLLLIYEQAKSYTPFTETIMRGLHAELLRHYSKPGIVKGGYKNHPNSVVEENHSTGHKKTIFKTAAPGLETELAMKELVAWYNDAIRKEPWTIAVACEFVFRFLAIHPFQDGNGRLGRALFLMSLLQSPQEKLANVVYCLAIDRHIERHKEEYYIVLNQCSDGKFEVDSNKYKIEIFLRYMLKVLQESLKDIDFYIKRVEAFKKLSESTLKVFECFKEFPEIRLKPKAIQENTGLPTRTVSNALTALLADEFIQRNGRGSATYYQLIF